MELAAIDISDEVLVEQAQGGCLDAFHQLVVHNHESVRLYFARSVNCSGVADDLAQEVFIAAFRQLKRFQHRSKFTTWLMGIARNKLLQHLRSQIRQRKRLADAVTAEALREKLAGVESSQTEAETHERFLEALEACMAELPEKSRRLIERFYFDGESSLEIADSDGRSSGAIRMKLMRIRELLHKCILRKSGIDKN